MTKPWNFFDMTSWKKKIQDWELLKTNFICILDNPTYKRKITVINNRNFAHSQYRCKNTKYSVALDLSENVCRYVCV